MGGRSILIVWFQMLECKPFLRRFCLSSTSIFLFTSSFQIWYYLFNKAGKNIKPPSKGETLRNFLKNQLIPKSAQAKCQLSYFVEGSQHLKHLRSVLYWTRNSNVINDTRENNILLLECLKISHLVKSRY